VTTSAAGIASVSDLRGDALFEEARTLYGALWRAGAGEVGDLLDLHPAPDLRSAAFTGAFLADLDHDPGTRIGRVDLDSGEVGLFEGIPGNARLPKFSPDGNSLAFLHDRDGVGRFQLSLQDCVTGAIEAAPPIPGTVEYFHWSPGGSSILLASAPPGADLAAAQGGGVVRQRNGEVPEWLPTVRATDRASARRRLWVYQPGGELREVEIEPNVWEACWCGEQRIAAIVSAGSDERDWYDAQLAMIEPGCNEWGLCLTPGAQLGCLSASPDGSSIALVEALCSDRGIVAGDLRLWTDGRIRHVDVVGMDVSHTQWLDERRLLCAGIRGLDTVVALLDSDTLSGVEIWSSREITTIGRVPMVVAIGDDGDFAFIGEGFRSPPHIAIVASGSYRSIQAFGDARLSAPIADVHALQWQGEDGLMIDGWLLEPAGSGPHPLVMNVHGGPVWQWRPAWLSRPRLFPFLMLLARGYAIFLPNPRGSCGRGQSFAQKVVGDTGGGDASDLLSGLDHLVAGRIADADRLGVTGVSYGGFMSAWLVTQDHRFAASAPVAPAINRISQHLTANHSRFLEIFLEDRYDNPEGEYLKRSPIMHARKARTPTLLVCGALDRCTPPTEAAQFYNALRQEGVPTVLVTYPLEGHGIHHLPAIFDYAARLVDWFERHMPAGKADQA